MVINYGRGYEKIWFGCMRLPLTDEDDAGSIDFDELFKMVDEYIAAGGNYFDTGWNYHDNLSENAVKRAVIERYPRDDVIIADKMPIYGMTLEDDPEAIFTEQLERCGVDYFDYYLVHNTADIFYEGVCKELNVFEYVNKQKEEGKIKKLGISHHDSAEVLEKILNEHPEIEFVQLQLNYMDWVNEGIQAGACYDVVRAHNLPVIVMEPLKGGNLVNIPEDARDIFLDYSDKPISSWAFDYVLDLEGVEMVLTGMSNLKQTKEDIETFKNFKTLTLEEREIFEIVKKIIFDSIEIPCTYCDYCAKYCPMEIPISKYFSLYNDAKQSDEVQVLYYIYYNNYADRFEKASGCSECGACEEVCPQHIVVHEELKKVVDLLEDKF